jgi:hypothetical protein
MCRKMVCLRQTQRKQKYFHLSRIAVKIRNERHKTVYAAFEQEAASHPNAQLKLTKPIYKSFITKSQPIPGLN